MNTKQCGKCREEKPLTEFHNDKNKRDGKSSRCKECANVASRRWTADNRQRARDSKRGYARKNPRLLRDQYYRKTYGIGLAEYESMGDACHICGKSSGGSRALAVDHDHSCCEGVRSCGNCVRGLLCMDCNTGLGKFRDDPELLRAAIDYLS